METISYTALRKNLAQTMEHICHDHAEVVVTRSNAEPIVMISLKDYQKLQETEYLFSKSPANAKRLIESIDEIESMIAHKKSGAKKCKD